LWTLANLLLVHRPAVKKVAVARGWAQQINKNSSTTQNVAAPEEMTFVM
jgi:hypothetical protein